eukprot:scaffold9889_cov97-Alexandrium_tamarense.AAC.1
MRCCGRGFGFELLRRLGVGRRLIGRRGGVSERVEVNRYISSVHPSGIELRLTNGALSLTTQTLLCA